MRFSLPLALLLTGCSGAKSSTQTDQDLTYTDMLFDTVIKIQILDPADKSILDGLKKLCEKYDTMFSTTNTDSELYKLNPRKRSALHCLFRNGQSYSGGYPLQRTFRRCL